MSAVIAPLFDELVAELGHDPLDKNDKSWDEYHLTSEEFSEKMKEFQALVGE